MIPNYGLYGGNTVQSKSLSRMDSYDPGNVSESAMSSASSHFTKIFQPPKSKPPPIPMPFAERTIYVHVKNEKELEVTYFKLIFLQHYYSLRKPKRSLFSVKE